MSNSRHNRAGSIGRFRRALAGPAPSLHAETPSPKCVEADAAAWADLGRAALVSGDHAEALWSLRRALEADSDNPAIWRLVGRCFELMGEEGRACMSYTLAARLRARIEGAADAAGAGPAALNWKRREPTDT
ncbi:MAG TPA: tetratricopeptide repeat protein [Candidatus Polarisedimenticolia bacterium]|nr:tetratricopeptide repeat protein [Candidatus Polarisedimenticolia bacterium]